MSEQSLYLAGFTGLDSVHSPSSLDETDLPVVDNLLVNAKGELVKRGGLYKASALTDTLELWNTLKPASGGGVSRLMGRGGTGGNSLVGYESGGGLFVFDSNSRPHWGLSYNDLYYYSNALGVRTTTPGGALVTLTGSPTNTRYGIFYKQRLFVVENDANGAYFRLRWSDPNNFNSWPSTNTLDILMEGKSDKITGLAIISDVLYIFKLRSIWALYVQGASSADWILRLVNSELGGFPSTFLLVDNMLYFFAHVRSETRIYVTDGTTFSEISVPVANLAAGTFEFDPVLFANRITRYNDYILFKAGQQIVSAFYPDADVLAYNLDSKAWSSWNFSGVTINSLLSSYGEDIGIDSVYFAGATGGTPGVYRFRVGLESPVWTDDGSAFTAKFRTREFLLAEFDQRQRIKWAGLDYESASAIQASYITENGTTIATTGAAGGTRNSLKVAAPQRCRRVSYEFSDQAGANSWKVLKFGMKYSIHNRQYAGKVT